MRFSNKTKLIVFIVVVLSGFMLYAAYRKEIAEIQKPFYLKRKTGPWLEKSRIVGTVKNPPEGGFHIMVFKEGSSKPAFDKGYSEAFNVYETCFLPLGSYNLSVDGNGYLQKTTDKPVKLKIKSDCVVNIVFE